MNRHVLLAVVAITVACKEPPPPKRVDTAPPPDTTTPPPPPPAPVSRLGTMPVDREFPPPPDGQCAAVPEARNRVTYTGDTPIRTATVSYGDASRRFRPRSIEIKLTQINGGITETESIYASFTSDGSLETGTRDYVNSSGPHTRESVKLSGPDYMSVRSTAAQILRWCRVG